MTLSGDYTFRHCGRVLSVIGIFKQLQPKCLVRSGTEQVSAEGPRKGLVLDESALEPLTLEVPAHV